MSTVAFCEICDAFRPGELVDIFGGHKVCPACADRAFDYLRVQVMKDLFVEKYIDCNKNWKTKGET